MVNKSLTHSPIESTQKYQYLVLGKGLFGSAAARYLSEMTERIAIVGTAEPREWAAHEGVFASHYDEARIVSWSAPDKVWQQLDSSSIEAYEEIETRSGVPFFSPTGRLSAVVEGDAALYPYLGQDDERATAVAPPHPFPYHFPHYYQVVYEPAPSGHLNPRKMVAAQLAIAQQQGAEIIEGMGVAVEPVADGVRVVLADGRCLLAEKVLLATGAFTNCFNLVERKLALKVEPMVSVLAEVSPQRAESWRDLPPLNYKAEQDGLLHLSILPPLPYGDGRFYMKIVTQSPEDGLLPDFEAINSWFRHKPRLRQMEALQRLLQMLLPGVDFLSWQTKPCVGCYTPSGKPMIDCLVDGRVYVAAGGNSGAAHPSDAIGKLAARLVLAKAWQSELAHEPFQVQFADEWQGWMISPNITWGIE